MFVDLRSLCIDKGRGTASAEVIAHLYGKRTAETEIDRSTIFPRIPMS